MPPPRPQPPTGLPPGPPRPGASLPGLTPEQLTAFAAGRVQFRNRETPGTGLGPIFNEASCFACHSEAGPGGAGRIQVTRFGRTVSGTFDPLTELGGSLLQRRSIRGVVREIVPPEANTVAQRQTTALWGMGLIEAIADQTLIDLAAQPSVDGVQGRVAMVKDLVSGEQRVGRFGWKNQHATLLAFSADAFLNEMGITNKFFPDENAPNGKQDVLDALHLPAGVDDEADPATGKAAMDRVTDFMRFLAPLPQTPLSATTLPGQALFKQVGCAVCHVPTLTTGTNAIAALSNKPAPLYSDLLLHDMGSLGDGIAQGAATGKEFRTAPLWGLRASAPFLHDGRARTVDQAIRMHEGQGATARDRYTALSDADKAQLLRFLNTL